MRKARPGLDLLALQLPDDGRESSLGILDSVVRMIQGDREQGHVVFVHCHQGVSRAATVVLATLMSAEHKSFTEAYAELKAVRPMIDPTARLRYDLLQWEYLVLGQRVTWTV